MTVAPLTSRSAGLPAAECGRRAAMLTVLLAGQFMGLLDVFVVNVALPTIGASLRASGASLQLVVGAYIIAYAMLLITGARLGDLYGRRRMYLIGVIVLTVSSLTCGCAPTSGALVAFRFAQGAGAAVMVPQIMSVIRMHFVGPARARALSAYGAVLSAGAVAGQIVGGPTPPWSSPKAASSWLARPSFPPAGSSEPPGSSPNGTGDGTSRPTRTALPTEPARRRPPPVPILRPLIKEKCERHACQSSDCRTAAVLEMSGTWVASSTLAQEVRPMPDAYAQLGAFLRGWCEFPDAELAKVRQVFRPVTAPRGVLLTRAGEQPDRVAFIAAGLVRL